MSESIRNLPDAVAAMGALPMPVAPEPQALSPERERIARMWHAELARLSDRTAVARRESLGDLLDEIDRLRAERHVTNEALSDAAVRLRADRDRIAELEKREAVVAEFVAARAEYITAIHNCHPDNAHDYDRWQGHAAARRQLAELLGLPVAWPVEAPAPVVRAPEGEHYPAVHHAYRLGHDLPEAGGAK